MTAASDLPVSGSIKLWQLVRRCLQTADHRQGGDFGLQAVHAAEVRMSGGEVRGNVELQDEAVLEISSGIIGNDVNISDDATVMMSNGVIEDDLRAIGESRMELSGGSIQGGLEVRDRARATITNITIYQGIDSKEVEDQRLWNQTGEPDNDV